jgi:hypothetical protein
MSSPAAKDVVTALVGASSAVAGLVLVFLGMVVTAIQGFPGDTPAAVTDGFRNALVATLLTFLLAVVGVVVDVVWLAVPGGSHLYHVALVLFGASVITLCFCAAFLAWPTLR